PFELPIHQANIKALEDLCAKVSASDEKCECSVRVIQQDLVKGAFTRRKQRDFVTVVYISGSNETAVFVRGLILKSVPVALVSIPALCPSKLCKFDVVPHTENSSNMTCVCAEI